jgi:predicted DNA-binding transcriptional regulator AlpA
MDWSTLAEPDYTAILTRKSQLMLVALRERRMPKATKILEGYLSERQLAVQLGISLRTLYRWNERGFAPPRIILGRKIIYSPDAVRSWLDSQARKPRRGRTSRAAGA